jgi:1,4-alpha-glucan branching enzyme
VSWKHEEDKIIVFDRAGVVFCFNFHPTKSFPDYFIGVDNPGTYKIVLDTDEKAFGGFGLLDHNTRFTTYNENFAGRRCRLQVEYGRRYSSL